MQIAVTNSRQHYCWWSFDEKHSVPTRAPITHAAAASFLSSCFDFHMMRLITEMRFQCMKFWTQFKSASFSFAITNKSRQKKWIPVALARLETKIKCLSLNGGSLNLFLCYASPRAHQHQGETFYAFYLDIWSREWLGWLGSAADWGISHVPSNLPSWVHIFWHSL